LNSPLTIGLLLLIKGILKMRPQNIQNRLKSLPLCSLTAREELSEVQKTLQVLLAAGMVWILNRLKHCLEEAHNVGSPY